MFLPLCLITHAFGLQKPKTKALTSIVLDLISNLRINLKDYMCHALVVPINHSVFCSQNGAKLVRGEKLEITFN